MKRIIWSNYYNDIFTQEAIEEAKEAIKEEYEAISYEGDVLDYDIEKALYEQNDYDFDDFKEHMKYLIIDKNQMLAVGTVGRWDGTFEGGKIINTFGELLDIFEDCDCIKFEDDNGHLYVTGSHHDGSISLEVKELTQKGEAFADRHWADLTDRQLHAKLWNCSNYSRLFRYDG